MQQMKEQIVDGVEVINDHASLLKFVDKDPDSGFYYTIENFDIVNSGYYYNVIKKPATEIDIQLTRSRNLFNDLLRDFGNWKSLIKNYNDQIFFKENLILDSYAREFYEEYKLLEDDADKLPFDLSRQLLIERYLDQSIQYLKQLEDNGKDDNSELIAYATEIKECHTQLTKNATIKRLSKFWALAREKGIPVLEKVFIEFAADVVIKITEKVLKIG